MHIQDPEQKAWIQARIEGTAGLFTSTAEEKREVLEHLTETEGFEQFLHVKFPGTKRFGLDGGESAIPALETIIRTAAELGGEEIVIGMPHRGRLNVLANVMGKPYAAILSEFQGKAVIDEVLGSGDVKYHLGTSTDRVLPDGRHDAPLAHRQPVASRGGQPGRDGQGARQADPEGRHRAHPRDRRS